MNNDPKPGVWLESGPKDGPTFVFAHGAGAGMESDFMEEVAKGLSAKGIRVLRFEFPYMQIRRNQGGKRPPDRAPKLLDHFKSELSLLSGPIIIGGKSMGGRMASMLAAEGEIPEVKAVVALGYPFHPQGKPENLRVEHLPELDVPMLVVQGTRDKLGSQEFVEGLGLPEQVQVKWLTDGDHDLKPRKASGYTHDQHKQTAIQHVSDFISTYI